MTAEVSRPASRLLGIGAPLETSNMPTFDCPWCDGELTPDPTLQAVTCDDCRVTVDLAPDPVATGLDLAA